LDEVKRHWKKRQMTISHAARKEIAFDTQEFCRKKLCRDRYSIMLIEAFFLVLDRPMNLFDASILGILNFCLINLIY
jgi:hypothetical protein